MSNIKYIWSFCWCPTDLRVGVKSTSELTGGIHIDSQAVESRGAVPYYQESSECNMQEKLIASFYWYDSVASRLHSHYRETV